MVNQRNYPAFFRFLTKKSFSLVSKFNFDFLSFSLNSVVKFFLTLLVFINNKNSRLSIQDKIILPKRSHKKPFIFSNIKFLLNIQFNTFENKHIEQILVILLESQQEIRLEILKEDSKFLII